MTSVSEALPVPCTTTGSRKGDWLVGDMDGVVVISQEMAMNVLRAVDKSKVNEEGPRSELASGLPVAEVYKKYGRM